jgi:C1A family cysteine protease
MYQSYEKVDVNGRKLGTGWLPPVPDLRDYKEDHPEVKEMVKKLGFSSAKKASIPASVDWRSYCSPVEDQGGLGSCSANAGVGVVEYFQNRAFGKFMEGSRLFVYKTTRNLMQVTGDTGAWLRTVMGALALCGVADEKYWPYTDQSPFFDNEPSAFVYSIAENFEALRYFCHDPQGANIAPAAVLERVKTFLAAGIPSMFGFWGFSSFGHTNVPGGIPYPCPGEKIRWGHAIVAVGYDDAKEIDNTVCNTKTTGALLIRNSWGTAWGDSGYGWLPYDYVLNRLALDFWSLLSMAWVDTKNFGI